MTPDQTEQHATNASNPTGGQPCEPQLAASPSGFDDDDNDDEKVVIVPEGSEEEDRKLRAESYKIMASIGNLGLFLLLAVIVGYFIGDFLDGKLGTKPWFTVFWILCGVAATVKEAIRNIKAAQKLGEKETPKSKDRANE